MDQQGLSRNPQSRGETRDLKLTRTRAALELFDRGEPALDAQLDRAETDEEVSQWSQAHKAASDQVREAFYQDTKDRNCRENCMIVELSWLRELTQ